MCETAAVRNAGRCNDGAEGIDAELVSMVWLRKGIDERA